MKDAERCGMIGVGRLGLCDQRQCGGAIECRGQRTQTEIVQPNTSGCFTVVFCLCLYSISSITRMCPLTITVVAFIFVHPVLYEERGLKPYMYGCYIMRSSSRSIRGLDGDKLKVLLTGWATKWGFSIAAVLCFNLLAEIVVWQMWRDTLSTECRAKALCLGMSFWVAASA